MQWLFGFPDFPVLAFVELTLGGECHPAVWRQISEWHACKNSTLPGQQSQCEPSASPLGQLCAMSALELLVNWMPCLPMLSIPDKNQVEHDLWVRMLCSPGHMQKGGRKLPIARAPGHRTLSGAQQSSASRGLRTHGPTLLSLTPYTGCEQMLLVLRSTAKCTAWPHVIPGQPLHDSLLFSFPSGLGTCHRREAAWAHVSHLSLNHLVAFLLSLCKSHSSLQL